MKIDLSDLNTAFKSVQGGRLSDGVYAAKLLKAEVCRSKADRRQIVWDLEVRDQSENRSAMVKKFSQLDSDSMFWVASDLATLGVTLGHINDLHETLRDLAGTTIEIGLESSGNYFVVSFIRVL